MNIEAEVVWMRESVATAVVEAALEREGCSFCALRKEAEDAILRTLFREMVLDGDVQARIARRGLCLPHLQLIHDAPDKLGAAMILRTLVTTARQNPMRKGCYLCDRLEDTAQQAARIAADFYPSGGTKRALLLRAARSLCLDHLGLILGINLPRWRAKSRQEFTADCLEASAAGLASLADDLEWFIGKFDYRRADESWRGTEDVIERAIAKIAGGKP